MRSETHAAVAGLPWEVQNCFALSVQTRLQSLLRPDTDVESPTTSLSESTEQSTAEVGYSGVAAAAQSDSENDNLPDPTPIKET